MHCAWAAWHGIIELLFRNALALAQHTRAEPNVDFVENREIRDICADNIRRPMCTSNLLISNTSVIHISQMFSQPTARSLLLLHIYLFI